MANPFVHIELLTGDVAKAKEFYGSLFGWQLQDMPMPGGGGTYTLIGVGDGTGGGIMKCPDPRIPAHWLAYVGVDDIEASTSRARELGATIMQDVMTIGEIGRFAVIQDPTGATLAMWEAKGK